MSTPVGPLTSLRLLSGPSLVLRENFASHSRRLGPLSCSGGSLVADRLLRQIERSGLRGRGGGGFPAAAKLRLVALRSRRSRAAVVVANGMEGEPLSRKDRALLRLRPHLVLDGIALACWVTGADRAILAVGSGSTEVLAPVRQALRERREAELQELPVEVLVGIPGFVSGEETALVHWLNGGPPKPTAVPPRPGERGVGGRPTLVQNVETLANLALIGRFGADWFRQQGTPGDPGTALVSVSGAVERPDVYEVPLGELIPRIFARAGGGAEVAGVLVGGYFGAWLTTRDVERVAFSREGLAPFGLSPGAGLILALPHGYCGVAETARIVQWLAGQSAGQCGPCMFGLAAIAKGVAEVAVPGQVNQSRLSRLARWCSEIEGRGACHHPDGAAALVRSMLREFAGELVDHLRGQCCAERAPERVASELIWSG